MLDDTADQTEDGARRTRELGELRLVAACGSDILDEVVAADRKEIGVEILDR
jgi:hypothetical protein